MSLYSCLPARPPMVALLAAALAVTTVHTGAQAQQPAPRAPAPQPAPPGPQQPTGAPQPPSMPAPPPNYPSAPPAPYAPPPGYYSQYGQSYYPPPPPPAPRGMYRPFTLGFGLGMGNVWFLDQFGETSSEAGLSYTLRFGFGVTRDLMVLFAIDGAVADARGPSVSQTGYTMGVQYFPIERLYLRGGVGLATAGLTDIIDESGLGFTAGLGFEFARGYSTAVGLEMAGTFGRYTDGEGWTSAGLNLVLSFF